MGKRSEVPSDRRHFVGGSDARIIMGDDEAALVRLWREKRGEVEPEDLSQNLIVQLGSVTEDLNRRLRVPYRAGHHRHPAPCPPSGSPLDGGDPGRTGRGQRGCVRSQVHAAMVILGGSGRREVHAAAAAQYVGLAAKSAVLSVITGGGKWVEITAHADPLYQHLIVTAERKFWRCVESGESPRLFGVEPPKPRIEAIRIVDMSMSNAWAEFAASFSRTRSAHLEHEQAMGLMPEDAKEAIGHGIRAKRSKSGAVGFDLLSVEGGRA
jgi:hypothetical protein